MPSGSETPLGATDADAADTTTTPNRRTTILAVAMAVVVGVIVFGVIFPQLVDWRTVFEVLGQVSGWEIAALVVLGLCRYLPAGWIYALVLPGLGLRRGVESWVATTALSSTTPGFDIPLRFGMTRAGVLGRTHDVGDVPEWHRRVVDQVRPGHRRDRCVGAVLVTTLLRSEDHARRFGERGERSATWLLAKISREAPAGLVDRILDAPLEVRRVLGTNWQKAFVAAATSQLLNVVILLLSIRAAGIDSDTIAWYDVLLAQGIVIILTTIPITPGKFGIAEMIYLAVFTAVAGRDAADTIAAGVMISRMITWFLAIPIGWIITLRWQAKSGVKLFGGTTA